MLVDKVVMLLARDVVLEERAVAFVLNDVPPFVSAVAVLGKFVKLVCMLLGSIKLAPSVINSIENFFDGSVAVSIAGLKNGAIAGSVTATPVPPIAIERGSNEVNGIAQAEILLSSKENADNSANRIRMFSF